MTKPSWFNRLSILFGLAFLYLPIVVLVLVISSFTTGPGASTLPMKIYSQIKFGVTPEINAISTIILGIVVFGLVAAQLVSRRSEQRVSAAA